MSISSFANNKYAKRTNTQPDGSHHPIGIDVRVPYGTAGFRDNSQRLPFVTYRVGICLASLAALEETLNRRAVFGAVITASHNLCRDNGIKVVGTFGRLLSPEFETELERVINLSDEEFGASLVPGKLLANRIQYVITAAGDTPQKLETSKKTEFSSSGTEEDSRINHLLSGDTPTVIVAHDTRKSSPYLTKILEAGLRDAASAMHFKLNIVIVHEPLTTPQLHWLVYTASIHDPIASLNHLAVYTRSALISLETNPALIQLVSKEKNSDLGKLYIDCANGVAAKWIHSYLDETFVKPHYINTSYADDVNLNLQCGADHVKSNVCLPASTESVSAYTRIASFDGDADRLIYSFVCSSRKLLLLDGDHLAYLFACFVDDLLEKLDLRQTVKLGVVITGYANGMLSTSLGNRGIPVIIANTGVKNLVAQTSAYDISIYFEPNGHGSVVVNNWTRATITHKLPKPEALLLLIWINIHNPSVGDGISCLVATEFILYLKQWDANKWWKNSIEPYPNKLSKKNVKRRSVYVSGALETRLAEPAVLQEKIDVILDNCREHDSICRAFVRPSGTENILRIYVESDNADNVAPLETAIHAAIDEFEAQLV